MTGNLAIPADEWLRDQFEHEWCAECGRDHRHHTAVPLMGNWFARCDRPSVFGYDGALFVDPEGYEGPTAIYECGICGHYHRAAWNGDCREDAERFTLDDINNLFGNEGSGWEEVPMPGTDQQ